LRSDSKKKENLVQSSGRSNPLKDHPRNCNQQFSTGITHFGTEDSSADPEKSNNFKGKKIVWDDCQAV